jgi:Uma2 family endonuclease
MSTARPRSRGGPAVLYNIDWGTYLHLLKVLQTRRRFRLTYDRGTLEIMSPLWEHERPAYILGRFVDVMTEEFLLSCLAGRTLTMKRRRKQRGLEPDNCYWIANAPRMVGKTKFNIRIDPPPDLAIEVEVSRRVINRMEIYRVLKVPEIWQIGPGGVKFHIFDQGAYQIRTHSLAFPRLASDDLPPFVALLDQVDDNALVRQFRAWVRQDLMQRP